MPSSTRRRLRAAALVGLLAGASAAAAASCSAVPSGPSNFAPQDVGYEFAPYSSLGPQFDNWVSAFPAGPDGSAAVLSEALAFKDSKQYTGPIFEEIQKAMTGACLASAPDGNCVKSLDSFKALYSALPAPLQPALAGFTRGAPADAAFAHTRLTASPMLLQMVEPGQLPIPAESITGLEDLIARTGRTLPQLVQEGKVFKVDYWALKDLLSPAPNSHLEIPTALFFVDGPGNAVTGEPLLMPLAIKFNVYNQHTYSPKDSEADWMLAKAAVNSLDVVLNGGIHFVHNHFMLLNVCISASHNLAPTHPLYPLLEKPCNLDAGITLTGLKVLLPEGGLLDQLLAVSAGSGVNKTLPYLLRNFDWEGSFVEADIPARGLATIPNFAYFHDSLALFKALSRYARSVLRAFYGAPGKASAALAGDAQLQAFLGDLAPGKQGGMHNFPHPAAVNNVGALARIVAQAMWLGGVQHHALNSDSFFNQFGVYPMSPGKLFAAPPAEKGQLTEEALLQQYILPATVPAYGGGTMPGLQYFEGMVGMAYGFMLPPQLPRNATLAGAYVDGAGNATPGCAARPLVQAAAKQLAADFEAISKAIDEREAKLAGKLPHFRVLDPARLPYYTAV